MTNFQYYFHKLPCFNCKKTKVNTDLGWLTATMKDDVVAQAAAIIEQEGVEADLSVNVTCTKAEAPSEHVHWIPKYKALHTAELTYDGQHNIYTFRGAKTRDAITRLMT